MVAVINETLARQHWPDRDPVSDRVSVQFGGRTVEAEIVGVVGSVRPRGFDSQPRPELFLPHAQVPHGEMTYLVRAESDPATVISAVQRAVWSVDPLQAFYSVATVDQLLRDTMATRRFTSRLLALFGFMALVLAAVGIYGVIGEATNQRTREFGVRTALGAPAGAIVGMVVAGALRLALTGVALGLIAALALSQSISHLLFEVAPTDLMTLLDGLSAAAGSRRGRGVRARTPRDAGGSGVRTARRIAPAPRESRSAPITRGWHSGDIAVAVQNAFELLHVMLYM